MKERFRVVGRNKAREEQEQMKRDNTEGGGYGRRGEKGIRRGGRRTRRKSKAGERKLTE